MVLSQAVAPFFRRIARYVYFAGLDAELLEGEGRRKFCGKGIELNRAIHSSWILSLST